MLAGVAAEIVRRPQRTGSSPNGEHGGAWVFAVLAFTIAHATRGVAMEVGALFSVALPGLVFLSGTLLFAIVLHAARHLGSGRLSG